MRTEFYFHLEQRNAGLGDAGCVKAYEEEDSGAAMVQHGPGFGCKCFFTDQEATLAQ